MPTTTTNYGRQNISWPDLGFDPGALLHSEIVGSIELISNQISRYWSGSQVLAASGTANLIHNFDLPLTQLRVRIFESNAELSDALDNGFTLSNISNSTISIENTGVSSRTIEVYIEPRTRMRAEDLDPAIAISTTGNATFNDVIVSGDLTVNGTTTTINTATLEVEDKNILVNNGGTDGTAEGAGIEVEGTGNVVLGGLKYEAALASRWKVGAAGTEKQIVTVSDTQVLTEKDIDGGVASNARRITLPKDTKANLDSLSRKEATIVYATDEDSIYIDDGTTLNAVGGTSNSVIVTQASHGFVVGDVLYLNGAVYTKAIANSANTSSVAGIVSRIQSVNVFQLTSGGKMSGLTGLTVGADYFLSPTVAGAITNVEPTTTGYVSQPVGIALSATELQVAIKRGVVIGTSNVFTNIALANSATTTIQNISSFANGEGGVLTGVLKIDATTDYVFGFEISFTKDIAGVINHSVRYFAGDVLPGISVTVSGQNIQITLGTLAGFVSATARFQLSASAVSPSLQISSDNVTFQEATMFRNRVINGDFNFWQRATSQTSSGYGSSDRWFNEHLGSTKTTSRQTFTLGQTDVPGNPLYFARTVVSSVANVVNYVSKKQSIEGVHNFAGQSVTLSFWAKADASKNFAVEFAQSFGTGGSPSATVNAIGVTTFALTTAWKKFSATVAIPSISGKTLGTNGDDCLVLNMWFDAGSNYNARTNTLGQQSGTFDISRVQLEQGTVATPFEVRPYGTELALCERYCKSFSSTNLNLLAVGINLSATVVSAIFPLPTMRVAPTATFNAASAYTVLNTSGLNVVTSITLNNTTPTVADVNATVAGAGFTPGGGGRFLSSSATTASIIFSAEL